MDKTEALNRLTALESEATNLRKILEAPEPAASLLTKPVPLSGQRYFFLTHTSGSDTPMSRPSLASFMVGGASAEFNTAYLGGNRFQTEELAKAYAEAIDTMLLLRHQPGTVPTDGATQYVISTGALATECRVSAESNKYAKMYRVPPCFATWEQAEAAVVAVGQDRILRMFKTLSHLS